MECQVERCSTVDDNVSVYTVRAKTAIGVIEVEVPMCTTHGSMLTGERNDCECVAGCVLVRRVQAGCR